MALQCFEDLGRYLLWGDFRANAGVFENDLYALVLTFLDLERPEAGSRLNALVGEGLPNHPFHVEYPVGLHTRRHANCDGFGAERHPGWRSVPAKVVAHHLHAIATGPDGGDAGIGRPEIDSNEALVEAILHHLLISLIDELCKFFDYRPCQSPDSIKIKRAILVYKHQ